MPHFGLPELIITLMVAAINLAIVLLVVFLVRDHKKRVREHEACLKADAEAICMGSDPSPRP